MAIHAAAMNRLAQIGRGGEGAILVVVMRTAESLQCERREYGEHDRLQTAGKDGSGKAGADRVVEDLQEIEEHHRERDQHRKPTQRHGGFVGNGGQAPRRPLGRDECATQARDERAKEDEMHDRQRDAVGLLAEGVVPVETEVEQLRAEAGGERRRERDTENQRGTAQAARRHAIGGEMADAVLDIEAHAGHQEQAHHHTGNECGAIAVRPAVRDVGLDRLGEFAQVGRVARERRGRFGPERPRQRRVGTPGNGFLETNAAQVGQLVGGLLRL